MICESFFAGETEKEFVLRAFRAILGDICTRWSIKALLLTEQIYEETCNKGHVLLVKNSSGKHHLITVFQRQNLFLHPQDL